MTKTAEPETILASYDNTEERLAELGIVLPKPCQPAGNYRPALIIGNRLLISGHTQDDAVPEDKTLKGKVGILWTVDHAYAAARDIGLAVLASAKEALGGNLTRIERVVKVTGVVNAAHGFADHPKVINGFSDLFKQVFGTDCGVGVRSATGVYSLPGDVAVEITEVEFLISTDSFTSRKLRARHSQRLHDGAE